MEIKTKISASLKHKESVDALAVLIDEARQLGLRSFTWTAYNGDQREPSSLTLSFSKDEA